MGLSPHPLGYVDLQQVFYAAIGRLAVQLHIVTEHMDWVLDPDMGEDAKHKIESWYKAIKPTYARDPADLVRLNRIRCQLAEAFQVRHALVHGRPMLIEWGEEPTIRCTVSASRTSYRQRAIRWWGTLGLPKPAKRAVARQINAGQRDLEFEYTIKEVVRLAQDVTMRLTSAVQVLTVRHMNFLNQGSYTPLPDYLFDERLG